MGPGHAAVHDRPELPDVEVAPGALLGVVDPAARAALRARHGGAGDPADPDVQLLAARCGRLEPDVLDPPLGPQPHRVLEEPRQHPRLSVHVGTPLPPSAGRMVPLGVPAVTGDGARYPPKASMSLI